MSHTFEDLGLYMVCTACGRELTVVETLTSGLDLDRCPGRMATKVPHLRVESTLTKACTCGSSKVGSQAHSTWCDLA